MKKLIACWFKQYVLMTIAEESDGDMTLTLKCYQLAGDLGETKKYNTTGLYCLGKMYVKLICFFEKARDKMYLRIRAE